MQPGGEEGTTGLDGDAVGFALVVKGVQRDSSDYVDNDGDGVLNIDDACLWSPAPAQYDVDRDGCLDDDDDDGVPNRDDVCPGEFASLEVDLDRDGCVDTVPEEWKILIDFNEGCAGCAIDLHSALVKVDGVNVHAATWDDALSIGLDETPYWEHVLNQHPSFDVETFEEIELEIKLNFAYHQPSTSGRQFGSWPNNWDIIPSYNIPLSYWDVDIELRNDVAFHQEHVATMSRYYMYSSTQTHTHVFTWSKQPVHDHDGDGYGVPGLDYHGYCWDESLDGHEDEHDGYGYSQHNDCTVMRYNVNDEYPADGTQWADTDGDGYGDNASGYLGDIFPNDPLSGVMGRRWIRYNADGCPQRVGSHLRWAVRTVMGWFSRCHRRLWRLGGTTEKFTIVSTSGGGVFLLQPVKDRPWPLMVTHDEISEPWKIQHGHHHHAPCRINRRKHRFRLSER